MTVRAAVLTTVFLCAVAGAMAVGAERSRALDRMCALQDDHALRLPEPQDARLRTACANRGDDGHMREAP